MVLPSGGPISPLPVQLGRGLFPRLFWGPELSSGRHRSVRVPHGIRDLQGVRAIATDRAEIAHCGMTLPDDLGIVSIDKDQVSN
jgi:hypothetical protein